MPDTKVSLTIPTSISIAPRGQSFHGQALKNDSLGLPCRPNIGPGEYALIAVLTQIVLETMAYSPAQRQSADSYLHEDLVEQAQRTLGLYGLRIQPDPAMMARVPA